MQPTSRNQGKDPTLKQFNEDYKDEYNFVKSKSRRGSNTGSLIESSSMQVKYAENQDQRNELIKNIIF